MRGSASQRVWVALLACLGCLLCLHAFLQIQEQQQQQREVQQHLSSPASNSWTRAAPHADTKLPVPPLSARGLTQGYTSSSPVSSPVNGPVVSSKDTKHKHHLHKTTPFKPDHNGSIYSMCPQLHKPTIRPNKDGYNTFQPVLEGKSWVYSAYYDARQPKHVVKVIGIADVRQDSKPHFCRIWFNNTPEPDVRAVIEDIVPETHDKRFAAFIYTCHLRRNVAPYAISLIRDKCHNANVLPVVNNYKKNKSHSYQYQFTMCGPILQNNFNDKNRLVEMFETNGLFGANHFVMYNLTSGADIQAYLRNYIDEGLLDLLPWRLPEVLVDSPNHAGGIHYFAQLASLNDCLYRHLHKSKFIAYLDIDELLVPESFSNWSAVMSSLQDKPNHPKICSAVFRNTFFHTDWDPPITLKGKEAETAKQYGIASLVKTKREQKIWEHAQRSKYIADSNRLEMAGIHVPWKCIKERYNYDVSIKVAKLHHYRSFHPDIQAIPANAVQDTSIFRFKKAILQRVAKRHRKVLGL